MNELRDELGSRVSVAVIRDASHALLPEQPRAVVEAIAALGPRAAQRSLVSAPLASCVRGAKIAVSQPRSRSVPVAILRDACACAPPLGLMRPLASRRFPHDEDRVPSLLIKNIGEFFTGDSPSRRQLVKLAADRRTAASRRSIRRPTPRPTA